MLRYIIRQQVYQQLRIAGLDENCTSGSRVAVLLTQMTSYFRALLLASDWMSSHTSSGAPACLTVHDGRLHLA